MSEETAYFAIFLLGTRVPIAKDLNLFGVMNSFEIPHESFGLSSQQGEKNQKHILYTQNIFNVLSNYLYLSVYFY